MTAQHSDPTGPRQSALKEGMAEFIDVQARAPYNFVSLPEKMVEANTPPDQDAYQPNLLNGWFECTLETCSPTYIRGMLTEKEYREFGQKGSDELTDEQMAARARFFSTTDKKAGNFTAPVIPGSSLRGMLRELVEVIGNGRMRWVGSNPTFTYRAVAAQADDPLKGDYKAIIGNMAANVYPGYLECEGDQWYVHPAQTPKETGVGGRDRFVKVEDADIRLPGFINMNTPGYHPQVLEVSFAPGEIVDKRSELAAKARRTGKNVKRHSYIIGLPDSRLQYKGVLVSSGNMIETGTLKSPRYKHCILMPKSAKGRIPIPAQVIKDYRAGLTPYQVEHLMDWRDKEHGPDWGCLGNGKPVFYVPNSSINPTAILFFGHNPNFRIPAMLKDQKRASTPLDFVPEGLRNNPNPDLADAIFGWVEETEGEAKSKKVIGPAGQRAGRVSFGDAHFEGAKGAIWYKESPITPKILASPKVTTFQHYLVQDKDKGHNPDDKVSLAHFGTSPAQTSIRGHKFYWHKGSAPEIEYVKKNQSEDEQHQKSQLTQIIPIKDGVHFLFKLHFENLRPEELGVLCWALILPGEAGKTYRHKIGMGKPLGMGAVKIDLNGLHLTRRKGEKVGETEVAGRYEHLFDATGWFQPEVENPNPKDYMQEFEKFMLEKGAVPEGESLASQLRIRELLEMLQWHGEKPGPDVLEATRYMEIEREVLHKGEKHKVNEYKERPVLPSPGAVFGQWSRAITGKPSVAQVKPTAPVIPVKQAAATAKPKAEPQKKPQLVNLPTAELKPGHHLVAVVDFIDTNKDVYLKCAQHDEDDYCVIHKINRTNVDSYAVGKEVRLEVISVKRESGGWLVDCRKAA